MLQPLDMKMPLLQINLVPAQRNQFRYPQAVPVGDEDQGLVPMPVSPDLPSSSRVLPRYRGHF